MKNFKKIMIIPYVMIALFTLSCEDEAQNPAFKSDELPRIFGWSTFNKYFVDIEDDLELTMVVSPDDNATYKWFIDGVEVGNEKTLKTKLPEAKTYAIRFEVNRNGVTNSRSGEVVVTKPFVPKTYNKKVVGFMTRNGSLDNIDFGSLTHLVISSAVVQDRGEGVSLVDTTFATLNIPLIVKAAHNEGVYVMLDVTGAIDPVTGGGFWGNHNFYNVIKDVDKRTEVLETVMKFAVDNDLDGINIFLNNVSVDTDDLDPVITLAFFNAVTPLLPAGPSGKFFYSVTAQGGWLTSEFSPVVNVERIDWINLQPFRYGPPEIDEDAPFDAFTGLANTWIGFGMPKEKIVNGIPAFGLHYMYPDDGTTVGWGNMWMYTAYESYKSILDRDANAHTVNHLAVDDGIFYDGIPKVQQKSQYVLDAELGGVMIWSIENDSQDPAKSLVKAANTALGN